MAVTTSFRGSPLAVPTDREIDWLTRSDEFIDTSVETRQTVASHHRYVLTDHRLAPYGLRPKGAGKAKGRKA